MQPCDARVFQRFDEAADLFRDHLSNDLRAELGEQWDQLFTFAAMGHVLTHNQDVIDEKFLARVGNWPQPLGALLIVAAEDATVVLDVLDAVLTVAGRKP